MGRRKEEREKMPRRKEWKEGGREGGREDVKNGGREGMTTDKRAKQAKDVVKKPDPSLALF